MKYADAAIDGELERLRAAEPGNQDNTVNKGAFALASMIKGGWPGADEGVIKARFVSAVLSLTPSSEPWTRGDAELKWRNAMRDAPARALPAGTRSAKSANGHEDSRKAPPASARSVASLGASSPLPQWTPTDENGKPALCWPGASAPPPFPNEIRRHLYVDASGLGRRLKVKIRVDERTTWQDWYNVRNARVSGWQARKPRAYVEIPYYLAGRDPFAPEHTDRPIAIAEGEKDAEAYARAGGLAIAFGGSSSVVDCCQLIEGRDVLLLGDNDIAGRKWLQKQARVLAGSARSLKTYNFPDLPQSGDTSDFLDMHSLADLNAIIAALPEWQPDIGYGACLIRREIVIPPAMLIKRVLPVQGLVFIAGQSESGKTYAAISLAAAVAAGADFLGCPVQERAAVIYCAAEGEGVIDNRFTVALDGLGIADDVAVMLLRNPGYINDDWDKFKLDMAEAAQWLKRKSGLSRCVFILDTRMAGWRMEDENSNEEAGQVCAALRSLGPIVGGPVIVVHHYGKTKEQGLRGASAWTDNCDHVISLTAEKNNVTGEVAGREIAIARSRFSATGIIGKFELIYQKLGIDQYGDEFGDCSIQLLPPEAAAGELQKNKNRPRTRAAIIFHNALNNALIESGVRRHVHSTGPEVFAVDLQHVRKNFNRMYASGEDSTKDRQNVTRKAWGRIVQTLDTASYATETQGDYEWIWKLKE